MFLLVCLDERTVNIVEDEPYISKIQQAFISVCVFILNLIRYVFSMLCRPHPSLLVGCIVSHVKQNIGVPHTVACPILTFADPQEGQRTMVDLGVRCLTMSGVLGVRVSVILPPVSHAVCSTDRLAHNPAFGDTGDASLTVPARGLHMHICRVCKGYRLAYQPNNYSGISLRLLSLWVYQAYYYLLFFRGRPGTYSAPWGNY